MNLLDSLVRVRDRASKGGREAAALQRETTLALAPPTAGTPHHGMVGSPYEGSWTGLTASPQRFQGQAQMGAGYGAHVQDYPAFPNDQAPAALPNFVQDWTTLEGVM